MEKTVKIVQISGTVNSLFALDDCGRLWIHHFGKWEPIELPTIDEVTLDPDYPGQDLT